MTPTKNAAAVAPPGEWFWGISTPHLFDAPLRLNALRYQRNLYILQKSAFSVDVWNTVQFDPSL